MNKYNIVKTLHKFNINSKLKNDETYSYFNRNNYFDLEIMCDNESKMFDSFFKDVYDKTYELGKIRQILPDIISNKDFLIKEGVFKAAILGDNDVIVIKKEKCSEYLNPLNRVKRFIKYILVLLGGAGLCLDFYFKIKNL